jgi:OOP family OmpA-OmpF porin
MKLISTRLVFLPLGIALLLFAIAMNTHAAKHVGMTTDLNADNGYWVGSDGNLAKSGSGSCVRTGSWTPARANAECDPELMPKVAAAPVAPAPQARTEPVVVAAMPMPAIEKVSMSADALFDFDKSELKQDGKAALDEVVRKLNLAGAELGLIVSTGHTDSTGSSEYNMDLSVRRAEAVKDYLIGKGIDSNNIKTSALGESQPIADNATAEGRAENRHVEIEVTSTRTTQ